MNNNITVRGLYKTITKTKTHLVQSREIATTCVCPYLFKMSYPFGVSEGERDYLAANTVHDVMSSIANNNLGELARRSKEIRMDKYC